MFLSQPSAVKCFNTLSTVLEWTIGHITTYFPTVNTDSEHEDLAKHSSSKQLAKTLSEEKQIDAIFLDFSKAFDKVPHKFFQRAHLMYF